MRDGPFILCGNSLAAVNRRPVPHFQDFSVSLVTAVMEGKRSVTAVTRKQELILEDRPGFQTEELSLIIPTALSLRTGRSKHSLIYGRLLKKLLLEEIYRPSLFIGI